MKNSASISITLERIVSLALLGSLLFSLPLPREGLCSQPTVLPEQLSGKYQLACEDLAQALARQLPGFRLPFEFTPNSQLKRQMQAALEKYHFEVCQDRNCAGEKLELSKLQGSGLTVLCLRTLNLTLSRGYTLKQQRLVPRTALSIGLDE